MSQNLRYPFGMITFCPLSILRAFGILLGVPKFFDQRPPSLSEVVDDPTLAALQAPGKRNDSSIATWLLLILGGWPVEGSFSKKIDLFDVGMGDSCASSIV